MNRKEYLFLSLFLIPLLLVSILPTVIFGPVREGNGSTPNGISNASALADNLFAISQSISSVLSEGLQDVLDRIDSDFSSSGCDEKEIINPYGSSVVYNANRFLAMYCASMDSEIDNISIHDMETVMRKNKQHLYSFSSRDETRERDTGEKDPETGDPVSEVISVRIYTVVYNGESYFEDRIFGLSGAQKTLSDNYAQNLSLLLHDGIYQGIPDGGASDSLSYEGVVFKEGKSEIIYYNQLDVRWKDRPYGTDRIGGYGCGPTAMSIVVSSLSSRIVDPEQMAEWAYENGYWCSGSGSYHALIPAAARHWGLSVTGCSAGDWQKIADALANGRLVVAIMSKGHFTSSGHFIVLRGITADGKILVADPASYQRSQKEWDLSVIVREASRFSAAGGPFWIIGP